jgi:hypothetical protein
MVSMHGATAPAVRAALVVDLQELEPLRRRVGTLGADLACAASLTARATHFRVRESVGRVTKGELILVPGVEGSIVGALLLSPFGMS